MRIVFILSLLFLPSLSWALPTPGNKVSALYCMATNVFYEARDDGSRSQLLVALVTANRAIRHRRTVCDVVYRKSQFSWTLSPPPVDRNSIVERDAWREALSISRKVIRAMRHGNKYRKLDFTRGATHYHGLRKRPYWAKKMTLLGKAGTHLYYAEWKGGFK